MAQCQPLADIQFISDFAAFCRTKGGQTYNWQQPGTCALAQFGYPGVVAGEDRQGRPVPYSAYHAAALGGGPYTFSALATRLESLIADSPLVERVS